MWVGELVFNTWVFLLLVLLATSAQSLVVCCYLSLPLLFLFLLLQLGSSLLGPQSIFLIQLILRFEFVEETLVSIVQPKRLKVFVDLALDLRTSVVISPKLNCFVISLLLQLFKVLIRFGCLLFDLREELQEAPCVGL